MYIILYARYIDWRTYVKRSVRGGAGVHNYGATTAVYSAMLCYYCFHVNNAVLPSAFQARPVDAVHRTSYEPVSQRR